MTKGAQQAAYGENAQPLHFGLASLLFLLAFAAIFIGTVLVALGSIMNSGGTSSGAIILIGPIPIILGGGPYSLELVMLALALTIAAIVLFLFVRRRV